MAGHTATPWGLIPSTKDHGPYVTAEYGGDICDCYAMSNYLAASVRNGGTSYPIHHQGEAADANAAFIVRAVNAHDDLVAALKSIVAQDDIDLALDPQWAKFVARHALAKAGAL